MSSTMSSTHSETSYSAIINKASKDTKVGIVFSAEDDGVYVAALAPNGLAATSGLRVGDKVHSINGKNANALSAHEAASVIRQSNGAVEIIAENLENGTNTFRTLQDGNGDGDSPIKAHLIPANIAATHSASTGLVILLVQVLMITLFTGVDYGNLTDFSIKQYIIFRDIMVMLLLGFGYLMTFLEHYGLSAVGLTMLITALNMECNLLMEGYFTSGDTAISLTSIINAEFSAAALLISFGALIGRATPVQMCLIAVFESFFYVMNKVFLVFGWLQAEDVGGTITIHMFGAFFGLAAAYALGPQNKESASNNSASRVSDVFSLIGTTLLWVYWPSFVGATETGSDVNEMQCLQNTIMSLLGSTGAAFYLSQYLNDGKFDAVHIQNSTLAGGVAIGATARLAMGPGFAFVTGAIAGLLSVLGYFYSSPFLEEKLGLFDTCGVGNLHGIPSVWGGLASIFLVWYCEGAEFLVHSAATQCWVQLAAVGVTLLVSIVTGYLSGLVILKTNPAYFKDVSDYEDAVWWLMEA